MSWEGLRAAWPESAYCLAVWAGVSFPTAAGVPHGLCYTVIALHSICKLMLSLLLMRVKKKNSEGNKNKNNL